MSEVEICLERETANDESGLVVAIHVASGAAVEKDDVLFDIENSKATQEVVAPAGGIISHDLKLGQTVAFGVPIARVLPRADGQPSGLALPQPPAWPVVEPTMPAGPSLVEKPRREPRLSHAAAKLCAELGLDTAAFTTGFVTARDVRVLARPPAAATPVAAPDRPLAAGQVVGARKRAEIDVLSRGAGDTMLSVLGIGLGPLAVARAADDYMDGRITDLVIYEAARLMRKFPKLNAYYADGQIFTHDGVNAGLAMDRGGQLVVYGIADADVLPLDALSHTIADAVARYLANELTVAELSRATFTVTDLSADDLDFVLPLLPRGQSCIIGITHSAASGFRLHAGFDHRVTEGREVALFLNELRGRLHSFAARQPATPPVRHCLYCDRASQEAVERFQDKGLLKIVDREGRDAFCCASCWNGW